MDLEKEFSEFKEKVKDEFKNMKGAFDGLMKITEDVAAQIEALKKEKEKKKDESWF